MEVATALLTITLPIIATIALTSRQTQRILGEIRDTQVGIKDTQVGIRDTQIGIKDTQMEIKEAQVGIQQCLVKLEQLQRDTHRLLEKTHCLLRKLDVGLRANAAMHGWARIDEVSLEEIAKLPEPRVYDVELRICYYKSA
jgi:hypothetical protein